jgi:hypothetical protein
MAMVLAGIGIPFRGLPAAMPTLAETQVTLAGIRCPRLLQRSASTAIKSPNGMTK